MAARSRGGPSPRTRARRCPSTAATTGPPTPSPAAVTGNIYYCSPSAAAADACWPSTQPSRVLCLSDPWSRTLDEHEVDTPLVPVAAGRDADPIGLQLADGDHCRLRDGGAWDAPRAQPSYVGYYSCARGDVWGPRGLPAGINKSRPRWTVMTGEATGALTTVPVVTAYYLTTAP